MAFRPARTARRWRRSPGSTTTTPTRSAAPAPGPRVRGGGPRRLEGRVRADFRQLAGQEEEGGRRRGRRSRGGVAEAKDREGGRQIDRKTKGKSAAKRPTVDDGLIASAEAEGRRAKKRAARSVRLATRADGRGARRVAGAGRQRRSGQPGDVGRDLKRHLDEAGRGPVDEELTTLYRAASAHLKSGARAYAETVGSRAGRFFWATSSSGAATRCTRPRLIRAGAGGGGAAGVRSAVRHRPDAGGSAALAGTFRVVWTGAAREPVGALAAVAVALTAAEARAQSLVEQVPEDACRGGARSRHRRHQPGGRAPAPELPARERSRIGWPPSRRRRSRSRRRSREERVQAWIASTQPSRVTHPMPVEGFAGRVWRATVSSSPGTFVKRGEVNAWFGWRPISCQDQYRGRDVRRAAGSRSG